MDRGDPVFPRACEAQAPTSKCTLWPRPVLTLRYDPEVNIIPFHFRCLSSSPVPHIPQRKPKVPMMNQSKALEGTLRWRKLIILVYFANGEYKDQN